MTNKEFYKMHLICTSKNGNVTVPGTDILKCMKHEGHCKLIKCQNIHKGVAK